MNNIEEKANRLAAHWIGSNYNQYQSKEDAAIVRINQIAKSHFRLLLTLVSKGVIDGTEYVGIVEPLNLK